MTLRNFESRVGSKTFIVKESFPGIGYYYFVYDNGKIIYDDLQDTLEICKEIIFENYNVPLESWKEIEPRIVPNPI